MRPEIVLAQPVLLGQHDDRAALGRLVGQRRELRGLGQLGLADARHRHEGRRLAVAERDRAGLVEQQDVDVAAGLDRTAAQRQDIASDEAVHAGNADRAEQRADRRRDQRHQQRDQRRQRDVGAGEARERQQRRDDDQEDDRQRHEQDVQRDLVRRLAPLRALDQRDHAVQERLAGLLGDLHQDAVAEHARAAGHRAAIAAGLADDRRRLAGDRRLVDRRDALDDRAVAGDDLAGHDDDHVAAMQLGGGARRAVAQRREGVGAHRAQRVGLGFAAALGQRLGEVGEDDRQPEPDRDGEGEPAGISRRPRSPATVTTAAPSSTTNITGLRTWIRGSSLRTASGQDGALQGHRASWSRARLSVGRVDAGLAEDAEAAAVGAAGDQLSDARERKVADRGDAARLDGRVGLRDVGVDAGGRERRRVDRHVRRRRGPGCRASRP